MVDDFIATVVVHVGHAQLMTALAGKRIVLVPGIEDPTLRQLAVAPIPCGQHRPAIISTAHHNAGEFAIEIRHAGEETIDAIADAVVSPVATHTAPTTEI